MLRAAVLLSLTLQHLRSPRSTGCLLRGLLAITAVGLSPTSRRQLSGHTMHCYAAPHSDLKAEKRGLLLSLCWTTCNLT